MARYRKWDLRAWSDDKFRQLSPLACSGQAVWMALVLGPQTTNLPGLFEASEIGLADRFRWSLEDFREAFGEASALGMVKADWRARLVWLPNAPEYNRPESPNVIKSWATCFDELPECELKWEAYEALKVFVKALPEGFQKAFRESFRKPSVKTSPNHEHEHEQEHEQKKKEDPAQLDFGGSGRTEANPSAPPKEAASRGDEISEPENLDPDDYLIWRSGLAFIGGESKRSLLGKLIRQHGRDAVARKLGELMRLSEKPDDPAGYFVAAMRKLERRAVC